MKIYQILHSGNVLVVEVPVFIFASIYLWMLNNEMLVFNNKRVNIVSKVEMLTDAVRKPEAFGKCIVLNRFFKMNWKVNNRDRPETSTVYSICLPWSKN